MNAGGSSSKLRPGEIAILCAFALVADLYFAGQTALVVAYGETRQLLLTQSAQIATAEGGAFALGMLLAALSANILRPPRPKLMGLLALLAVAQFGSASAAQFSTLIACRTVSGVSAGLILSLGMAMIGSRPNPGRAFALYSGMLFGSGVISIPLITRLLLLLGLPGAFVAYGLLILLSLPLVSWLPDYGSAITDARANRTGPREGRTAYVLLLSALLLSFAFNGGIWVLSETLGLRMTGLAAASLSSLLATAMLFGLLGTGLATVLADRGCNLRSMHIANGVLIVSAGMLLAWPSSAGFFASMALLNAAAAFFLPAALSFLASLDSQGAQWGNLAAQAGYSLGPLILTQVDAHAGMFGLVGLSTLAFLISSGLAALAFRLSATCSTASIPPAVTSP